MRQEENLDSQTDKRRTLTPEFSVQDTALSMLISAHGKGMGITLPGLHFLPVTGAVSQGSVLGPVLFDKRPG